MVCLGNICRSPLAEGILKNKVKERGLNWQIDSAGTGSWHIGNLPDRRSIAIAKRYGIDITDQRAQRISVDDLTNYDLILAMDNSNYVDILSLDPKGNYHDKVKLLLGYAPEIGAQDVPDPYWNDDGFEQVYQMIDAACDRLIEHHLQAN
jgi:protein-tyrosine phosphatase